MIEVILFGIAAGLDNLQVSSSLGLLPMERRRMHLLATAFCICELGAALLGLMLGRGLISMIGPMANTLAPALTLMCGLVVLYLAYRSATKGLPDFVNRQTFLFALPVALSVDNVVAGAGVSFSGMPLLAAAVVVGVISAAMACFGLYFANWIRHFLPRRVEVLAGLYLCFFSVRMMLVD